MGVALGIIQACHGKARALRRIWPARLVSILPMLDWLDFVRGNRNWGWKFRLGLVETIAGYNACIAHAMGCGP